MELFVWAGVVIGLITTRFYFFSKQMWCFWWYNAFIIHTPKNQQPQWKTVLLIVSWMRIGESALAGTKPVRSRYETGATCYAPLSPHFCGVKVGPNGYVVVLPFFCPNLVLKAIYEFFRFCWPDLWLFCWFETFEKINWHPWNRSCHFPVLINQFFVFVSMLLLIDHMLFQT